MGGLRMIRVCISNTKKYEEGCFASAWIGLPATKEELNLAFDNIGIDGKKEEFFIKTFESDIDGIDIGEGQDLNELNYFAIKLKALPEYELDKFSAVLEHEGRCGCSIKYMINIINNLDDFTFYDDVRDEYELGYFEIVESGIYDRDRIELLGFYIDFCKIGEQVSWDDGGTFTEKGYVYGYLNKFQYENSGCIPKEFLLI